MVMVGGLHLVLDSGLRIRNAEGSWDRIAERVDVVIDLVLIFKGCIAIVATVGIVKWVTLIVRVIRFKREHWTGDSPVHAPLLYATPAMAVRSSVLGHPVPLGYRLASLYLGCTPIDRSGYKGDGLAFDVLDPLPSAGVDGGIDGASPEETLHALCFARAVAIVVRARREGRAIRLLWSGGIDSTAAACALLCAAEPGVDRLTFYYGARSRKENRRFYDNLMEPWPRKRIRGVEQALGSDDLVVTGEHGDQLFGSAKAFSVPWSELDAPWEKALGEELRRRFASVPRADTALEFLRPVVERAVVPIVSLRDALWWLSFVLKWQGVTLRIPARVGSPAGRPPDVLSQLALTEHFFRGKRFQRWAMVHRDTGFHPGDWARYKWPLKTFVHNFNGDDVYLRKKLKEPSLGHVMRTVPEGRCLAVTNEGRALQAAARHKPQA